MPIPLASIIAQGLNAAKPAAGTAGRLYFATDTGTLYYDTGAVWSEVDLAGSAGFSLDSITGAVTLVAGANITIEDNTPSAGKITISASGGSGSGAYLKGSVNLDPQSAGGTFTASGEVGGATVGSAVLVAPNNSAQASLFTNVSGWVSDVNEVTIQVTTTEAFIGQYLLVVVFL